MPFLKVGDSPCYNNLVLIKSPIDRDFRAVACMLRALQAINEGSHGSDATADWLIKVESALEYLDEANSHLFTGS